MNFIKSMKSMKFKYKTEHIIIICLVIPLLFCFFKRTEMFELFDNGMDISESADVDVDEMDETEFELNLEKENEDIEAIHDNLEKTYTWTRDTQHTFTPKLDGKRYSIPGYQFVYCKRYSTGVVTHYFTKRDTRSNNKCVPGRTYNIPGYNFLCNVVTVDPDCPDCPDCENPTNNPDNQPKYTKHKTFNVKELKDYEKNDWVFNKILYKNNDNSKNCDENNVSRNLDNSEYFVCCDYDKSGKNLLCRGKWDDLIYQSVSNISNDQVLVLKTGIGNKQQENSSETSVDKTHYNTIEYQYDTKLRNGLFIIDIAKIPKSELFVPKLSLKYTGSGKTDPLFKREIDILKAISLSATVGQELMGSSVFVSDGNKCQTVLSGQTKKCDVVNDCDVEIPRDDVDDKIVYDGAFVCEVINDNKIKLWYISKENNTVSYNNAVSEERPDPAKWTDVDPYVIYENCGDKSEATFILSIGTEFLDKGEVINEQNKPDEGEEVSWHIRGVRIFIRADVNVS
jgi:hypothetical protein